MFTRSEGVVGALVVAAALLATGCLRTTHCLDRDPCDGLDNDCDGQIDEDFRDAEGRYVDDEHCGRCGVSCQEAFPTASAVSCEIAMGEPQCRLVACPAGQHPGGDGACVPDSQALCLGCESDADCEARTPGARCITLYDPPRCGQPCELGCPTGFSCMSGQCFPSPNLCACEGVDESFQLPCLVEGEAEGVVCAGVRTCGASGLGECELAATELCNEEDDDCDGEVDEDFRDAEGRYLSALHCGGCGMPCASPGPNYVAECVLSAGSPACDVACAEGYVDVDGIRANGCECRLFDGQSAPIDVGGDLDCDGMPDDDDRFVHVTNAGDDANPGTILEPMRTLAAALARGLAEDKVVLVARGVYPAFEVLGGVNVFGGYRPDFRDRDVDLYPVFVEHESDTDGQPVLTCNGVSTTTVVEGLTVVGQPARTAGRGSTAVLLDGCTGAVTLRDVTVLAAAGADGEAGLSASQRLPAGVGSLSELDGDDGASGRDGDNNGEACVTLAGGNGGRHFCAGGREVSGGDGGDSGCPDLGCTQGEACANAGCTDFTSGGVCDIDLVLSRAVPNPAPEDGKGTAPGDGGEVTYDAPTNRGVCYFCDDNPTLTRVGRDGSDGADGGSGSGGAGCGDAALSFDALGRGQAPEGAAGSPGRDGSGGGGGSAGGGYARIGGTSGSCDDNAGGSGGGGGSGGCGAPAGAGGLGGGASIGIVLRANGDDPTFEQVRVITDNGGRGGDGGQGAAGGRGGSGAMGGTNLHWCARAGGRGGDGGEGGAGGGGGGGCGGGSHAVVVLGSPGAGYVQGLRDALEVERPGVAGQGGRGGAAPGASGGRGDGGASTAIVQL